MLKKMRRLPDYKPGYVGRRSYRTRRTTVPARHLSERRVATRALAVYPPATDEQPLIAGILDLATHKTCGRQCRHRRRWAFTPPFHPYPRESLPGREEIASGGYFLSRYSAVMLSSDSFPLESMALCVARTFLSPPSRQASDEPSGSLCILLIISGEEHPAV